MVVPYHSKAMKRGLEQAILKQAEKNGFEEVRQNGSHITMKNRSTGKTVVVPYHSKAMKRGLEQAILKQAGLK